MRGNDSLGLPWSAPVPGVSAGRLQAGDQLGWDHLDGERPGRPERWEQWLAATRKAMTHNAIIARPGGTPDKAKLRLLHAHCHRQYVRSGSRPALLPASEPMGLA